jgi:hypothetical protein
MEAPFFATRILPPKIIKWDKDEGDLLAKTTFNYAVGLPNLNRIDLSRGCVFMVRPEFRLIDINENVVKSIICEMPVEIHFLKGILPTQEFLLRIVKDTHLLFSREFALKEKKSLDSLIDFRDQPILEAIQVCMMQSQWL